MALITCPDCGAQVSDRAQVCIRCGCPLEETKNVVKFKLNCLRRNGMNQPVKYTLLNNDTQAVLAEGKDGQIITLTLDNPMHILIKRDGWGWKPVELNYTPHGPAKYNVIVNDSMWSSYLSVMEVDVFDSDR